MSTIPPSPPPFTWITEPQALLAFIESLRTDHPIALDTEADSLHHYRESVCLIQISHQGQHFLVDPLNSFSLNELWPALGRHTWILHGADFDLRMLRRAGAQEPLSIFDTLIGAQLLGISAMSYGALVTQYCNITLDKRNQKADWSRRPLSNSMLEYAVQDTCFLETIAASMTIQLRDAGRLEWHRQSCNRVLCASRILKDTDPENQWRLSGSALMIPEAQAILKELWLWRENEAEQADQPVFKILHNELLLELAVWAARHKKVPPMGAPGWPRRTQDGRIERMAEAIERGRNAEPIPQLPRGPRPVHNREMELRIEKLRVHREQIAAELKLDATLLASKSILLDIARDPVEAPDRLIAELRWCPWQWELLKPALVKVV